jgi:ATP-dependent protease ClpP protease subunit
MHYYFNDKINTNSCNNLVERLQNVEGKIDLYFTTGGGQMDPMKFLVDFLNTRKDDLVITFIDRICSAGTLLLTDFKGKIKFDNGLDFMLFHAFDRESYSIRKDIDLPATLLTKQDLKRNKIFAKRLLKKGILNEKQIKRFNKGLDVILVRKDFKKIKL